MPVQPIPAAQYVRMSTEHQQYSLLNQQSAIQLYAISHGFDVSKTYSDAAKSGLSFKHRKGLQQLLHDVVGGKFGCKAILVYDVSRWGRFQDADEAAYYEFICKSSGAPIHYCAEPFSNDLASTNSLMKALKRSMAGEYSRDLSARVSAGQRRLSALGFKQGGIPGYGLRRMLIGPDGAPKQILAAKEWKSLTTDHTILVPGPPDELERIHEIYKMFIVDGCTVNAIATELNRRGVPCPPNTKWTNRTVGQILSHPKYTGFNVFAQTTQYLKSPVRFKPKSEWILAPNAFEPIVDQKTFLQAQQILSRRSPKRPDREILDELRSLLAVHGKISVPLIKQSHGAASINTYKKRFGSLTAAYALVGYDNRRARNILASRSKFQALRSVLLRRLCDMFPSRVAVIKPRGHWRTRLVVDDIYQVSIMIVRATRVERPTKVRWRVLLVNRETGLVTLLTRLNQQNDDFQDFYLFPRMKPGTEINFKLDDERLRQGLRLDDLTDFPDKVLSVLAINAAFHLEH